MKRFKGLMIGIGSLVPIAAGAVLIQSTTHHSKEEIKTKETYIAHASAKVVLTPEEKKKEDDDTMAKVVAASLLAFGSFGLMVGGLKILMNRRDDNAQ